MHVLKTCIDIALWEDSQTYLGFGHLDVIIKVTVFYVGYLLNQWMSFLQTQVQEK